MAWRKKVTILELRQNPDPELSALADYVYGHVFVRYTMKQWGQTPEEIDPNTTARVPVFLSEDCRYFQDAYQGMPLEGYTPMFQSLLDHPDITVELGVDAASRLTLDGSAAPSGREALLRPHHLYRRGGRAVRLQIRPPALPHPGLPL